MSFSGSEKSTKVAILVEGQWQGEPSGVCDGHQNSRESFRKSRESFENSRESFRKSRESFENSRERFGEAQRHPVGCVA